MVERYYGPMYRRTMTDVDLPAVHADSSIAVELRHSDKLADNQEAYLQFALVHTDTHGNRRIRSAPASAAAAVGPSRAQKPGPWLYRQC